MVISFSKSYIILERLVRVGGEGIGLSNPPMTMLMTGGHRISSDLMKESLLYVTFHPR